MTTEQPGVDRLIEDLDSSDEAVRRKTLFQLGKIVDLRAISAIKHVAAEDSSPEVKYLARKLLALYEAKKPESKALIRPGADPGGAAEPPEAGLRADDSSRRAAALRACAQTKDPQLLSGVLARAGSDEKGNPIEPVPEVRSMIPVVLAQLGGKAQVENIATFLEDKDPRVKANALAALSAIGDQASWARIIRCVQDPDHRVKTAAIGALAKLGKVNLIKCCKAMIEGAGAKFWERDSAVHLLASAGLPDAVPILESVLTDTTPGLAGKALKGLETLAAKGCEPAKSAVEIATMLGIGAERPEDFLKLEQAAPAAKDAQPPNLQRSVGREVAVAAYGAQGAVQILIEQIRAEKNVPLLVGMLRTLGQIGDPAATPVLKEFLAHEVEEVRGACVEALRALGTDEALNSVIPALKDRSLVVVGRAIVALRAHPHIDLAMPIGDLASHADVAHRRTAVLVVGELAEKRFAPVIENLVRDEDPGVAAAASLVLMKLRSPAGVIDGPRPASSTSPPAVVSPATAPAPAPVMAAQPAGPASPAVAAGASTTGMPAPIPAPRPTAGPASPGPGRRVTCPKCKETVFAPESAGAVRFQCPACESTLLMSKFHVEPQLLVTPARAPEPAPAPAPAQAPAQAPLSAPAADRPDAVAQQPPPTPMAQPPGTPRTAASALQYPPATWQDRCVAVILDNLVSQVFSLTIVGGFIYFAIKDWLGSGQSLGKRPPSLLVIDASTGEPCSLGQSCLRNSVLLGAGLVASVIMLSGDSEAFALGGLLCLIVYAVELALIVTSGKRLGDMLAGTRVVKPQTAGPCPLWASGLATAIVVLGVGCGVALGTLLAIAQPKLKLARIQAQTRACFANQKTIAGAIEMCNLDTSRRQVNLDVTRLQELVNRGYLKAIPEDPGQGPDTAGNYESTDTGNGVTCRVHGQVRTLPPLTRQQSSRKADAAGEVAALLGCGGCTVFIAIPIVLLLLHLAFLAWVSKDAKARAMDNPILWMLLVMVTGLMGLLIYLIARPAGSLVPCKNCGAPKLPLAVLCPHCADRTG
ncbi:MAG: HEAT repeat domain-containing protein [Candidatus Riflebacteria bacterium]|nr:HEAT repeat domain-containing protein [Candidatus Riflebacteria bacterium]